MFLVFCRHTWQVQDKIDANNVAYTTGKLSFHTDYPALHYPPGVRWNFNVFSTSQAKEKGSSALSRLYTSPLHSSDVRCLFWNPVWTHKQMPKSWTASLCKGKGTFSLIFLKISSLFLLGNNYLSIWLCQDRLEDSNISRDVSAHISPPRELRENEMWKQCEVTYLSFMSANELNTFQVRVLWAGSVDKSVCCTNMKIGIQMPVTQVKRCHYVYVSVIPALRHVGQIV